MDVTPTHHFCHTLFVEVSRSGTYSRGRNCTRHTWKEVGIIGGDLLHKHSLYEEILRNTEGKLSYLDLETDESMGLKRLYASR